MAKREIQAGDYFLLPYAGPRRARIVKAVQQRIGGHWYAADEHGNTTVVLLSSCSRIAPSQVARICKTPAGVAPSQAPSQHPDTILLDFIASEYLDVSAFAMPTGAGDADVGWKLVQEHEGKKGRVEVACHYRDDLRAAIREAMQKLGYTLPASGVPPVEGTSHDAG